MLHCTQPIAAQVVPDQTLPLAEQTLVTGNPNFQIDGGARRGGNLFHSFSQFSIPTGGSAFFNNAADVQNILTRVTGKSISNIDGLIRAQGTANLFLLNPNGIIFGPNARLDVGGSFVASTASSIKFADGAEFSALEPLASPLLTISVPIGLQFNGEQGDIVLQPRAENQFTEVDDAGQLPSTAQPVNNAIDGTNFNVISGNLDNVNDVDLYKLSLTKGQSFVATTLGGTQVDTQLFLFDGNGLGLVGNDDIVDDSIRQSIVPLNLPFTPAASGTYYLGISSYNNNPRSPNGYIFSSLGEPNGPGSGVPLSEWDANKGSASDTYKITLNFQPPLQVQPGKTLALVGGNVTIKGANLQALGGRVELGGVAQSGTVGLSVDSNNINLSFPRELVRADISTDNSSIDVRGSGGSVSVLAQNIDIKKSLFLMGIPSDSRLPDTQTGDLDLNATGSLTISDNSTLLNQLSGRGTLGNINLTAGNRVSLDRTRVVNNVKATGVGNAGNINVTTASFSFTEFSRLFSDTNGQGNTSNININARDTVSFNNSAIVQNFVQSTGIGNAGDINITTGSLFISSGGLNSFSKGQGNTSTMNINARDTISFNNGARIENFVQPTGIGNAGNINITTGSLFVSTGGLTSFSNGQGNASTVNINARDTVSFYDYGRILTGVQLARDSVGNSGDVNITTGLFSLSQGQISSFSSGTSLGNTGNININARDTVSLVQGASLSSSTTAPKISGSVNINAGNSVSLDNGASVSTRLGNTQSLTPGRGGDINITTGAFSLTHGSALASDTIGRGNAGSVNINARDTVIIDGESDLIFSGIFKIQSPSQITTGVLSYNLSDQRAVGQGGDVNITTDSLFLTNGGAINTSTQGQGNAGRVTIYARDSVEIRGTAPTFSDVRSGVFTSADAGSVGSGGDLVITTGSLAVSDSGRISTNAGAQGNDIYRGNDIYQPRRIDPNARAQGNAGNIQIHASGMVLVDSAQLTSTLDPGAVGRGGDIDITAQSLSLLNGAQLSASTRGKGNAGNITVSADTIGLSSGGQILTTTASNSRAGDITVNTPNLQLWGATSGLFAETTNTGDAGDLIVQPHGNGQNLRVNLQQGAQISASTRSSGRGGTLTIAAPESIPLTGNGSVIAAETGGTGTGGNLNLRTDTLSIQNQAQVTASSSDTGSAGNLFVDADRIFLNNQGKIRADTSGSGGNLNLRSRLILLRNGSNITTNATGSNIPGGNIEINTQFLVAGKNEDSNISANSRDFRGGNVTINAYSIFGIQPRLQPTPLSDITATGANFTLGGTLNVTTARIDPTSSLVELPTEFYDLSQLIVNTCPAQKGNSFIITGRGGLPPTPEQQLDDDADWQDQRRFTVARKTANSTPHNQTTHNSNLKSRAPIIEATEWRKTPTGEVLLIASTSDRASFKLNHLKICTP